MKHTLKVKSYVRYTDDFVIVSDNREYLEHILQPIRAFLYKELLLELHPQKVSIRSFYQGIDFLGYIIFPKYRLVRVKTKKRMFKKFKKRVAMYHAEMIDKETLNQSLQSYLGVLSHANAYCVEGELNNLFWYT